MVGNSNMMKTIFNLLFLLLCVSLAGYLPGMQEALPLIGMTPVGCLGLGLVLWAGYDLVFAPLLDGIQEEKGPDGKSVLSYTVKGRKALVVQLVAGLAGRLFKAEKAKKSGKKVNYEKKINLS